MEPTKSKRQDMSAVFPDGLRMRSQRLDLVWMLVRSRSRNKMVDGIASFVFSAVSFRNRLAHVGMLDYLLTTCN